MASVDEISPTYVGEDRIVLTLSDPDTKILANVPFQVDVNYAAADPEGIILPLELVLHGPNAGDKQRVLFERAAPSSVLLVPRVRGRHTILLKELFHNRWQGRLTVNVEGEDLQTGEERVF